MSPLGKEEEASRHRRVFQLLRDAYRIRDFQLQLYADVWDPIGEYAVRTLKEAVEASKASGLFDCFFPEPLIVYNKFTTLVETGTC